jgi:hypothetical protein
MHVQRNFEDLVVPFLNDVYALGAEPVMAASERKQLIFRKLLAVNVYICYT